MEMGVSLWAYITYINKSKREMIIYYEYLSFLSQESRMRFGIAKRSPYTTLQYDVSQWCIQLGIQIYVQ